MRSIDTFSVYRLAKTLSTISNFDSPHPKKDLFGPFIAATTELNRFIEESGFELGAAAHPAHELHESLVQNFNSAFHKDGELDFDMVFGDENYYLQELKGKISQFEHVLAAEMRDAATYFASKVGIFETKDLVERAENSIPDTLRISLPKEVSDEYQFAGRALAFNLHTACGFHVLRAVEITLKEYYGFFFNKPKKTWPKNMGALLRDLQEKAESSRSRKRPDRKTLRTVDQIRDLDRNRLMHPEDTLSAPEAHILFNNAVTAICSMAAEMLITKK